MSSRPRSSSAMSDADYTRLADFRHALRRFLLFSERAAAAEGLTAAQHQALLVIRGRAGGTTTISVLAERLCLKHHTAVELTQRLEAAGLVEKHPDPADRRAVILTLSPEGAARLERLTLTHKSELGQIGPEILTLLQSLHS